MPEETAIRVDNVYKDFVLPHEKVTSVKGLFTGLTRRRRGRRTKETQHALKDISFEVRQGEFFGIVGRNGSGKSTLLKILAGIYQPTSGEVHTKGKLVPFIELGVGFNPELTGRENVYLNGAMLGFSEKEIDAMYDSIVEFAELERFMDQKLKNYSSGMQVRLAFSMAIRAEADILLIDEVLAVGDADFQRKCYTYFKSLKKDKKTVVFVSHDMDAVREYCDRAMLIEQSEIIMSGDTGKVTERYARLFNTGNQTVQSDLGSDRWGDESLITSHISVKVSPETIKIIQKVHAKQNIDQPVIGIRVRDISGSGILGTNTRIEGQRTPSFKKGSSKTITWELPNVLAEGEYMIDPAIMHSDSITVTDWWDDALRLRIDKGRHLPYPADPGFKVDING